MECLEVGDFIEILDNHFGDWGYQLGEVGRVLSILDKDDFYYAIKWLKDGIVRRTGKCCMGHVRKLSEDEKKTVYI